ncbi:hypothetical protein [Kitasatospora mediocidica]|uniref:hypothetical protein n=1 Tax=Kitasatospora mediocidica TaxID=58352 RepID=UPI00056C8D50|nr:hypothetical protein [Kitasatospora mediocidica]
MTRPAGTTAGLLELAARRATASQCRHKMAAVLASGNRVLAARPNLRRNSPRIDFHHATFHAEEAALRRVRNTAGTVIYVARVNAEHIPMLARPCRTCQHLLAAAGVVRAYYTVGPGEVGRLDLTGLDHAAPPCPRRTRPRA